MGNKCFIWPKIVISINFEGKNKLKNTLNQLFLDESLFPYILAVCTWIFMPKFKKLHFEVIAGNMEKRISVCRPYERDNIIKDLDCG